MGRRTVCTTVALRGGGGLPSKLAAVPSAMAQARYVRNPFLIRADAMQYMQRYCDKELQGKMGVVVTVLYGVCLAALAAHKAGLTPIEAEHLCTNASAFLWKRVTGLVLPDEALMRVMVQAALAVVQTSVATSAKVTVAASLSGAQDAAAGLWGVASLVADGASNAWQLVVEALAARVMPQAAQAAADAPWFSSWVASVRSSASSLVAPPSAASSVDDVVTALFSNLTKVFMGTVTVWSGLESTSLLATAACVALTQVRRLLSFGVGVATGLTSVVSYTNAALKVAAAAELANAVEALRDTPK